MLPPTNTSRIGMLTRKTTARSDRSRIAMIRPPIIMPGARSAIRMSIATKFCIWVTSLVTLVTSDPVENRSMLPKENPWIFRYRSLRISPAKAMLAFELKKQPPMPPPIMNRAIRIIRAAVPMLEPTVSVPAFPALITRASSMGISTSPMTSTIMHNGPRINQVLYGLIYFIQCFKKALSFQLKNG